MNRKKGITLIELIIAISISTMVLGIAYTTINSGTKFFHQQSGKVFARNDVRLVLNQITNDIQEAREVDGSSANLVFIQQNDEAVSYYYDSNRKAVVRLIKKDSSSAAAESVFIDSVTNSFSITKSISDANTFNIGIETLNLKKYWGSKEVETHKITVSRRYGGLTYLPIPLKLSRNPLPNGTVNQEYNWPFSAIGGTEPYTFSLDSGSLPAGLRIAGNTLSGTPTSSGVITFTIKVQDSSNPKQIDAAQFTLNVLPASSGSTGTPFIDFNGDRIVNGNDYYINLKLLTDAELDGHKYEQKKSYGYIYTGAGELVIPKSPSLPSQYNLYLYAANGIVIKDSLQTQNRGHDITLESNGPIYVDNITISAQYITIDSLHSISRNQTKFVYKKSLKLVVKGKDVSP